MSVYLRAISAAVFWLGLWCSSVAAAATITYQASDLPDTTPGEDLWQYQYTVNANLHAFDGFNVFFSPALYASLEASPAPPNADWFVTTVPIDAALPADGVYNALALSDNPALSPPFSVSFVWLGSGTPGAQTFEIFDPTFTITETGVTTLAAVPEPASVALLCVGLLAVIGLSRRR